MCVPIAFFFGKLSSPFVAPSQIHKRNPITVLAWLAFGMKEYKSHSKSDGCLVTEIRQEITFGTQKKEEEKTINILIWHVIFDVRFMLFSTFFLWKPTVILCTIIYRGGVGCLFFSLIFFLDRSKRTNE